MWMIGEEERTDEIALSLRQANNVRDNRIRTSEIDPSQSEAHPNHSRSRIARATTKLRRKTNASRLTNTNIAWKRVCASIVATLAISARNAPTRSIQTELPCDKTTRPNPSRSVAANDLHGIVVPELSLYTPPKPRTAVALTMPLVPAKIRIMSLSLNSNESANVEGIKRPLDECSDLACYYFFTLLPSSYHF
jgi:hypothetical protein